MKLKSSFLAFLLCGTASIILFSNQAIGAEAPKKNQNPPTAPQPFNPQNKTEEEIIEKWGQPKGRMEMGDELHLMFDQGAVTLKDKKAISFTPNTPPPRETSKSASTSFERSAKTQKSQSDEAELYLKRLQKDLEEKQRELADDNMKLSKETEEINRKHQESKDRAYRDYDYGSHSYSSYKIRIDNIEKDRLQAIKDLEIRYGIDKLKNDIKQIEEDIRNQYEKMSR